MSTKKMGESHKNYGAAHMRCAKQIVVSTEQEILADYVRRIIKEKNLRYRQISERSGGGISPSAISDIISGRTKEIKSSTISALAKGLDVPEEEVFDVVRGKTKVTTSDLVKDEEVAALFYNYTELTEEDKQELRAVMQMLREEIKRRNLKPKKKGSAAK